ncbi:putative protein AIM2 [Glarea lozoyensis 74030]|uniref:Dienelactone hydrolase domain-containing protein n=1 Tax=Glarea lozoyensis (strain ATCC 74030 / MF5533) TaxID=1104152 RepID=H0ECU8_GLAL7|nr:putative protein AIM2 [Glarea lozoyensis 74030]
MSCPDCFRGGVTTIHPTGTETTIHGVPTYVAQPDEAVTPKGIVVVITDAFGWKFANNRVLSDHLAKRGGFLVYCPDFMKGLMDKIIEPTSWFNTIVYKPIWVFQALVVAVPWKLKTKIPATHPGVISFFQALRTSPPPYPTDTLKVGAAGYCYGGKHAFLLAHDKPETRVVRHESQKESTKDLPLIDCAFSAHPSLLELPVDVDAVALPLSVVVGDKDAVLKAPEAQKTKDILEAKGVGSYEVKILQGAKHGFAIRPHPEDKEELEFAETAEVQAIEWFKRWFA